MSYDENELKQLQNIQLSMLNKIKEFCNENKIEFFLIGGTALGARRHEGFIPWDDDIDIGMRRQDYDKFVNLSHKLNDEEIFVQTPNSDANSPFAYTKVRKNNSIFLEYCNKNSKMHSGIYVDVFPFDFTSENQKKRKKHFTKSQFFLKLYIYRMVSDITQKPDSVKLFMKQFLRKLIHLCMKLVKPNYILKKLENEMTKYNSSHDEYLMCLFFPEYMIEFINVKDLYPLKLRKFENNYYYTPNKIEKYLETHYGDFMKLPDIKDRVGHEPYRFKLEEKNKEY